jgi:NOL1/NOP2/fmu family ribosome biogenesis protein
MLKEGGRLVYSTCTFSKSEDEEICEYLTNTLGLDCLKEEKLYPHKIKGEGHYAALFGKKTDEGMAGVREVKANASKSGEKEYREFEKKFFKKQFAFNLYEAGGILYELSKNCFDFRRLNVLRAGVRLGELTGGRFEPSHSLAMCLKPEECKRVVNLAVDSLATEKFLRGETVEAEIENGWCLVCVDNFPIGFGKCVNGTVKNHIPKALRKRSGN